MALMEKSILFNSRYDFLLKGREDLRQDERVMQLFSLVNKLLTNNRDTERRDLAITTYSVIPLSTNETNSGYGYKVD